MKFYPPGEITPYGAKLLLERVEPLILYTTYDGTIQWCINGGLAPWPGIQEGACLVDGVSGMHPPFTFVEHKGARQAGSTVQATVYDPAEYDMQIELMAPPDNEYPEVAAAAMRRVVREWVASWDPDKPGTLKWITPDMGQWTCTPRLYRSPPDRQFRAQARRLRQRYTWTIRNDDAFWRGVDSMSDFRFEFKKGFDGFNRDSPTTLGPQWSQTYTGAGAGTFGCNAPLGITHLGRAQWFPSGGTGREVANRVLGINEIQTVSINGAFTGGTWTYTVNGQTTTGIAHNASPATFQAAIIALSNVGPSDVLVTGSNGGPYSVFFQGALAFTNITTSASGASLTPGGTTDAVRVATQVDGTGPTTATDNQVITVKLGELFGFGIPENGFFDIWGRRDGNDANPTGVRVRVGGGIGAVGASVTLSRFNAGVETVMDSRLLLIAPLWWETWRFQLGTATTPRRFKVERNNFTIMNFKETGTGSSLGASFRGCGFGVRASTGIAFQGVPASIDGFWYGDNSTVTQSGHVQLTNFGDQDGYPRYLVYGPGTFRIADGPGSENMIEFGPLADNQVALLTTLPRLRGVVDLSPEQPEQTLSAFQAFVKNLISLAVNSNLPPLLEWFESLLGIRPPQGELYSLLDGRFTKPIPAKPSGEPPSTASIAVEIVNGDADSKIIAALTPLRRWPE